MSQSANQYLSLGGEIVDNLKKFCLYSFSVFSEQTLFNSS